MRGFSSRCSQGIGFLTGGARHRKCMSMIANDDMGNGIIGVVRSMSEGRGDLCRIRIKPHHGQQSSLDGFEVFNWRK